MTKISGKGSVDAHYGLGTPPSDQKDKGGRGLQRSSETRGTRTSASDSMAPRSKSSALGQRVGDALGRSYDKHLGDGGTMSRLAHRSGNALERGYDKLVHTSPKEHLANFEQRLENGYDHMQHSFDRLRGRSPKEHLAKAEDKLAQGHDWAFGKPAGQHAQAARAQMGNVFNRLQDAAGDVRHLATGESPTVGHAASKLWNGSVSDAGANLANVGQAAMKSKVMKMNTEELGRASLNTLNEAGNGATTFFGQATASVSRWWNGGGKA